MGEADVCLGSECGCACARRGIVGPCACCCACEGTCGCEMLTRVLACAMSEGVVALRADTFDAGACAGCVTNVAIDVADDGMEGTDETFCLPLTDVSCEAVGIESVGDGVVGIAWMIGEIVVLDETAAAVVDLIVAVEIRVGLYDGIASEEAWNL